LNQTNQQATNHTLHTGTPPGPSCPWLPAKP